MRRKVRYLIPYQRMFEGRKELNVTASLEVREARQSPVAHLVLGMIV